MGAVEKPVPRSASVLGVGSEAARWCEGAGEGRPALRSGHAEPALSLTVLDSGHSAPRRSSALALEPLVRASEQLQVAWQEPEGLHRQQVRAPPPQHGLASTFSPSRFSRAQPECRT